jgi:hypothetical protein
VGGRGEGGEWEGQRLLIRRKEGLCCSLETFMASEQALDDDDHTTK